MKTGEYKIEFFEQLSEGVNSITYFFASKIKAAENIIIEFSNPQNFKKGMELKINEVIMKKIYKNIEGSMLLSLLNRVKSMDEISNSTYLEMKKQILAEYQLKLE